MPGKPRLNESETTFFFCNMYTEHIMTVTSSYDISDETDDDQCIPVLYNLLDDTETKLQ